MRLPALALCALALPVHAQSFGVTEGEGGALPDFSEPVEEIVGGIIVESLGLPVPRSAPVVAAQPAAGAVLRGLDKVSGQVTDLELAVGEEARLGRIIVALDECRYPAENPSGDAFALVRIAADGAERPVFEGWMIASSPALSALEHPRYDVWVIRCNNV